MNVVLVRHGETEWTLSGRHTSRTDIPLTNNGRGEAEALGKRLRGWSFARALSSPMQRALDTCRLAGVSGDPELREDLMEWDYGDYEGRTTKEIRAERPGWFLFRDGAPEGETAAEVGMRVDRVIAEIGSGEGDVAVFAHGHVLRVFGARWIELRPADASRFALDPASLSLLGYERETPVIILWNETQLPIDLRVRARAE